MGTYKLNKVQKGKNFEYTVTDENGNIISKRVSARDYVACTANGEYYFGRLDLIGKGDHGKYLKIANLTLNNPKQRYTDILMNWTPSFRLEWKEKNPYEEWAEYAIKRAKSIKEELDRIAYL